MKIYLLFALSLILSACAPKTLNLNTLPDEKAVVIGSFNLNSSVPYEKMAIQFMAADRLTFKGAEGLEIYDYTTGRWLTKLSAGRYKIMGLTGSFNDIQWHEFKFEDLFFEVESGDRVIDFGSYNFTITQTNPRTIKITKDESNPLLEEYLAINPQLKNDVESKELKFNEASPSWASKYTSYNITTFSR